MTGLPSSPRARLVLVHGSMSSSAQWADYPALLPEFDVVAVDLPGHGLRREEPFSIPAALEVIADAMKGSRRAILVGHSLGGYVCARFAAETPTAAGLVLIGATGDPSGGLTIPYRVFAWLSGRVPPRTLVRLRLAVARRLGVRTALLSDAADYRSLPAVLRAVAAGCGAGDLARVTCPVLFINGRFDQMRIDERRYLRLTPQAQLAIIPRATHLAPLTHPVAVADRIRGFAAQQLVERRF